MEKASSTDPIKEITHYIEKHGCRKNFLIKNTLEKRFNLKYESFRKKFRNNKGISLKKYHDHILLAKAIELLHQPGKIYIISLDLGFCDDSHFIHWFKKHTGYTPTKYRQHILQICLCNE